MSLRCWGKLQWTYRLESTLAVITLTANVYNWSATTWNLFDFRGGNCLAWYKFNAGHDQQVSVHTEHSSLRRTGLHSSWAVWTHTLPLVHHNPPPPGSFSVVTDQCVNVMEVTEGILHVTVLLCHIKFEQFYCTLSIRLRAVCTWEFSWFLVTERERAGKVKPPPSPTLLLILLSSASTAMHSLLLFKSLCSVRIKGFHQNK